MSAIETAARALLSAMRDMGDNANVSARTFNASLQLAEAITLKDVGAANNAKHTGPLARDVRVVFTIANDDGTDTRKIAIAYQPGRVDIDDATRVVVDTVRAELLRRLTEAT